MMITERLVYLPVQIMLGTSPATAPLEFGLDLLSSVNRSQYVLEALQIGYPTASTFAFMQADFEHEITVNIPVFFTTVSGNITDYQVAPNAIGALLYFIMIITQPWHSTLINMIVS